MLLSTLALVALGTGPVLAGLEPASSAELCGRCHRSIHEAWKASSHAQAMESRLFQDVLEMAETDSGPAARKVCLECHSPVGARTGDLALTRKVSWEGVTCDFCHSITDVSTRGPNAKAAVAFSLTKTGPLKDSESTGHATAFSPVHTSSVLCATCHEYRNASGFAVLTTYSEFRDSPYAKQGMECQSCHMSRVAGQVVDPKIKRSAVARINLHQMPGSHSLEQLTSTLKAHLNTQHSGDQLEVSVEVSNKTAGHYLPTGSPLRRLVLEVRADSYGGQHFREERVYMRQVADKDGSALMREDFAFLKGAKVLSDTRLAPGENRLESFRFAIPAGTQTQVTATFRYCYSPMARTESQKQITFLTLNRLVR